MDAEEKREKFFDKARNVCLSVSDGFKHDLQACVNFFNSECNVDLEDFKKFPWISTYPTVQFLATGIDTTSQEDTALKLIKAKDEYNNKGLQIRRQYTIAQKRREIRKLEKRRVYSKSVIQMANHLDNDPDKFFSGEYDWYFTGGTLDVLQHELYGAVAFWACGSALNDLRIVQLGSDEKRKEIMDQTLTLPNPGTIYQISGFAMGEEIGLVIRQKNTVTILQSENSIFSLTKCKTIESLLPFVSVFFDKEEVDFVYTMDVEFFLKKWDIRDDPVECSAKNLAQVNKFRKGDAKKASNWATIQDLSAKHFIYADQQQLKIRIIDKVQFSTIQSVRLDDLVSNCSEICAVAVSKFPNLIYVATTHDCFALDVSKSPSQPCFQLRWTHHLTSHPIVMKTCLVENNTELILLSSLVFGDLRILCNEREVCSADENETKMLFQYKSYHLPYKMQSMSQLYEIARLKGKCLNPKIPTLKRISFSTCGVAFVSDSSERIKILTANSVGDIFTQNLTTKLMKTNDDLNDCIEAMEILEKNLSVERRLTSFKITGRDDLKPLKRVFRGRRFNQRKDADELRSSKRRLKWKRRIVELRKCTDVLAQDLLAIWEFSDEELEESIITDPTEPHLMSAKDKVAKWLNSIEQDVLPDTLSFPHEGDLATPKQTLGEAGEDRAPVQKTPLRKAKRKSHVGGF
ncbi:uncharacterized protein LOC132265119 [Phlebotomus argentipes]|uniref:uncharacterized protein LOC132265119 n=1 Tax=Phlebotomus argentipes TaxID=94469 RepID=UPI0028934AD6|nr:uncharacterized protein LOC132265119 [Phlebotomus argentipes]